MRAAHHLPPEIVTERPGHPAWDAMCSPAAKAARAARDAQRRRIMEEARGKGWRHWRGPFWKALERKLTAIGCDPRTEILELRIERAQEAVYAGSSTKAERELLAQLEEDFGGD